MSDLQSLVRWLARQRGSSLVILEITRRGDTFVCEDATTLSAEWGQLPMLRVVEAALRSMHDVAIENVMTCGDDSRASTELPMDVRCKACSHVVLAGERLPCKPVDEDGLTCPICPKCNAQAWEHAK